MNTVEKRKEKKHKNRPSSPEDRKSLSGLFAIIRLSGPQLLRSEHSCNYSAVVHCVTRVINSPCDAA